MVIAAAATREGARVRPVVSIVRALSENWRYPPVDDIGEQDPNQPLPLLPAFPLPPTGTCCARPPAAGEDEQHTAFAGSGDDRPLKSDPVLDFALGPGGPGWAVGGWSGDQDAADSGSSGRGAAGKADRARVQTAAVFRFGDQAATPPGAAHAPGRRSRPGPPASRSAATPPCQAPCADLALQEIRPDRSLVAALAKVAELRAQPHGPRMMLYTGGRWREGVDPRVGPREMGQYASLLASQPVPVYPALSATDVPHVNALPHRVRQLLRPVRGRPAGARRRRDAHSRRAAQPGRPHPLLVRLRPAPEGTVRVIVIDNSSGTLAASDPHQNPLEDAGRRGCRRRCWTPRRTASRRS